MKAVSKDKAIRVELIHALRDEIEVLKRGKGGNTTLLIDGRLLRESAGFSIYVFRLENFLVAVDDSPGELQVRGNTYQCQIVSTYGLEVHIAVETNLGNHVAEALLLTNVWFLLEMLAKKLEQPKSGLSFAVSERVFSGESHVLNGDTKPTYTNLDANEQPDESQRKGIEKAYTHSLSVIWGPPGTGKTKTIAHLVEAHLRAGRRVLLLSHANAAVDQALSSVAKQLEQTSFYQEGRLVRLGVCRDESLEEEYPLVILDKIAARLGESLISEKTKLQLRRARLDEFIRSLEPLVIGKNDLEIHEQQSDEIGSDLADLRIELDQIQQQIDACTKEKYIQEERLADAKSAGIIKRFFLQLDPVSIQNDLDRLTATYHALLKLSAEKALRHRGMEESLEKRLIGIAELRIRLQTLAAKQGVDLDKLEEVRQQAEDEAHAIDKRIGDINRGLDEMQAEVLANTSLLATTLTKTYTSKQFPEKAFDVVIIDESSMAPLPQVYWACRYASTFVTIVGDFNQLPPIAVAKSEMATRWLKRSIFDVIGVNTVGRAERDPRVVLLDTQYRMAPDIANLSSRLFYDGLVKSAPNTQTRSLTDPVTNENKALVLVDTSSMNPWCSRLSSRGFFNLYSGLVAASLVDSLLASNDALDIGVVAPFRAQARLIGRIAEDRGIRDKFRVDTIHSFQGGEKDVMVIDCVESQGLERWSVFDDSRKDSDADLLLNVALTRAKYKVFLIVNSDHFSIKLNKDSTMGRLMNEFANHGAVLSSGEVVDSYFDVDFDRWALAFMDSRTSHPVGGTLYTEGSFWSAFLADLQTVQQRVIIVSPFISINRADKLMDYFQVLANRGIDIRVFTRPPAEQGSLGRHVEEVVTYLKNIGAVVVQRRGMHQKVAILDHDIVWEGSLNILSHRNTQEQMRRLQGVKTVEEVIKNLELDQKVAAGDESDKVCRRCGEPMVVRRSRSGYFLGCSKFPKCRHTQKLRS